MLKIELPPIIFGTSGLGNLYVALSDEEKRVIVSESVKCSSKPVVFDSAGKYGAGLALESLGRSLKQLNICPSKVLISNKLGWLRVELSTDKSAFQPGVWRDLRYDAVQNISYAGIRECYEQGNELLGNYRADLVSVHEPDEYLSAAKEESEHSKRHYDILGAYRALRELKHWRKLKMAGLNTPKYT